MSSSSEDDRQQFKNVYEGVPEEIHDEGDDSESGEDIEDSDSDSSDKKYKLIPNLTADEVRGLKFLNSDDALTFYASYARSHGFVVRKDEVRRNEKGDVTMRQYVCNKEGFREIKYFTMDRKRSHRPLTRTNCKAKLRIHLDYEISQWRVVSFHEEHNHELTPSKYMHVIPAYRTLSEADKAQVDNLHAYGVRTCHIMGYMTAQKGGHSSVGFLKEDLYSYINKQKHYKIKGGDAQAAISYLRGKADNDAMFFSKYTTTEDNKLKNLFWADGCSRADFQCFGDVLSFDATYGKTKYNHPLVIFSGSNHHSQTIVFGAALVVDETTETYKWVLETFLEAMCNKHPKSVVTDGDGAMREAIKQVFPNAKHRLCLWHLNKNARDNVKNKPFLKDFNKAMKYNFTIDEFEEYWKKIIGEHGLEGNPWVSKTYDNRYSWATAYLRDHFFAGVRTTSPCEAINCRIKPYVGKKNCIVEFLHNIEQAVRVYRENELEADYKSLYTSPVLDTTLYKFESEAANVFTQEIFKEVKIQIENVGDLNLQVKEVDGEIMRFKMQRYSRPNHVINVVYDTSKNEFLCDCHLFQSRGIPCAHIFCAMRIEYVESIPASLICRRWRKDAKKEFMPPPSSGEVELGIMRTSRFSAVAAACNDLCRIASENGERFSEIMDDILKLTSKHKKKVGGQRGGPNDIRDPNVIVTKGAPPKKRYNRKKGRCSKCHKLGHTRRTCSTLLDTKDDHATDVASPPEINREVEREKDCTGCDENIVQQTKHTSHPTSLNNVKSNGRHSAKAKKQKGNSLTLNAVKEMETIPNCSTGIPQSGTPHMVPQNLVFGNGILSQASPAQGFHTWMGQHNTGYGYGNPSHKMAMPPFYGFVPLTPQTHQVTIPPHVGGGHSNLLHQVMNNAKGTAEI